MKYWICLLFILSTFSQGFGLSGSLEPNRYNHSAISPWLDVKITVELKEKSDFKVECWLEPRNKHSEAPVSSSQVRTVETNAGPGKWETTLSEQNQWFWLVGIHPAKDWQLAGRIIVEEEVFPLDTVSLNPVEMKEATVLTADQGSLVKTKEPRIFRYRGSSETGEASVSSILGKELSSIVSSSGKQHEGEFDLYLLADQEGTTHLLKGYKGEVIRSSIPVDGLVWLKTLEWNFSRSPISTGWEPLKQQDDDSYIIPWYHRDPTKRLHEQPDFPFDKKFIPERLQHLAIDSNPDTQMEGGWRLENLFRAPTSKDQQRLPGKNHRDQFQRFPNRLLRFDVILSANVPGDQIPVIQFVLHEGQSNYKYTLERLVDETGAPLKENEPRKHTFIYAPSHHLEKQFHKAMDFEFLVSGKSGNQPGKSTVYLENLSVWEAIIGDSPGKAGELATDQWPMASPVYLEGDGKNGLLESFELPEMEALFGPHTIYPNQSGDVGVLLTYQTRKGTVPHTTLDENYYRGPYYNGVLRFSGGKFHNEVLPWDPFYGSGIFTPFYHSDNKPILFYTGKDPKSPEQYEVRACEGNNLLESSMELAEDWIPTTSPMGLMILNRKDKEGLHWTHRVCTANTDELTSSGSVVLHQMVKGSVLDFGKAEPPSVVYEEFNSDAGTPEIDSQNPFLMHDAETDLFYLAVAKVCSYYPGHGFLSDFITLDRDGKKLILTDTISGDRSILIDHPTDNPLWCNPIDMAPVGRNPYQPSVTSSLEEEWHDLSVLVLDQGDKKKNVPASLLRVNCIDGTIEPYFNQNPGEVKLENPTEMTQVPSLFYGEQRWEGFLVADIQGVLLAKTPSDPEMSSDNLSRILAISQPKNLAIRESGVGRCRTFFHTRNHQNAFNLESKRFGKPPYINNGEIYLYFLHPGVTNSPLSVQFKYDALGLIGSIYLATNQKGEVISTQKEVVEAIESDKQGKDSLNIISDPQLDEEVVVPQYKKLPGGLSARTLYYTALDPSSGDIVVWEANLTDIDHPGRPVIIARSDFRWDPVALLYYNGSLYLLDNETKSLYQVNLKEGPDLVEQDDAVLTSLSSPINLEEHRGRVYLFENKSVSIVDTKEFRRTILLSNNQGHGENYQEIATGIPVHWDIEENAGGIKVYWSQLNKETGMLEPFTHERYIGWFPFYDAEFFPAKWLTPDSKFLWLTSTNKQQFNGQFEIMSFETTPPGN